MSQCTSDQDPTRLVADPAVAAPADVEPGFTWVNGVALGLMLIVGGLFHVGRDVLGRPLGGRGYAFFLAYAVGLAAAVAIIRPRAGHLRRLSPLLEQIVIYLLFWANAAFGTGLSNSLVSNGLFFLALLFFIIGFTVPLNLWPYARRVWPLLIVELFPWILLGTVALEDLLR